MRVLCRHGHFAFYPRNETEVGSFVDYYKEPLVRVGDFYTFPALQNIPDFSIKLLPVGNLPAVKNFEGRPWDVMRENGFVYSLALKLLVPKAAIPIVVDPKISNYYWLGQTPLLQPGSRNLLGQQILSYDAEYIDSIFQLRILEMSFV